MPELWLRVALVLYGIAALGALLGAQRKSLPAARWWMPAVAAAVLLHLVSLIEAGALTGEWAPASWAHAASLLAFLLAIFFLGMWARYRTASPAIFILPLVFLLTLAGVFAAGGEAASPLVRTVWIFAHVILIFLGYAALLLSLAASLLYLAQERRLKRKAAELGKTPALETIDQIGWRSLVIGFPLMTLGLATGAIVAQADFGAAFFRDPKILLSILVWLVYLVLLYSRWSAGWRGRRAAYLAGLVFLAAIGTWAANYLSGTHRFLGP